MAPNSMAPNFFSLTSLLLASSFFFALSNTAPIPKTMDVESRDNTLLLPSRDMWSEVAAVKPRYSPIDNIRLGNSVLPSGRSSRILPRSPAESHLPIVEDRQAEFSAPKPSPVAKRQVFSRFPIARPLQIGSVMSETGSVRQSLAPRMGSMGALAEMEKRTEVFKKATFDPKEPAQKRGMENAPIGATKVYSGKIFRRGLKTDTLA